MPRSRRPFRLISLPALFSVAFSVSALADPPKGGTAGGASGSASASASHSPAVATSEKPLSDEEVLRRVLQTLPVVEIDNLPFESAISLLAAQMNVQCLVIWTDLESNGIPRDQPVSLSLTRVSGAFALQTVLWLAGADVYMAWDVHEGVVLVATKEFLNGRFVTRTYSVADLLQTNIEIQRRLQRARELTAARGPAQASHLVDMADTRTREERSDPAHRDILQAAAADASPPPVQDDFENARCELLDLIRASIEPDCWAATGGGAGEVRVFNGVLVVHAPPFIQRRVEGLLADLRASGAARELGDTWKQPAPLERGR